MFSISNLLFQYYVKIFYLLFKLLDTTFFPRLTVKRLSVSLTFENNPEKIHHSHPLSGTTGKDNFMAKRRYTSLHSLINDNPRISIISVKSFLHITQMSKSSMR